MSNKNPSLVEILTGLLRRSKSDYVTLSHGLVLAYTPGQHHRLCLSRKDGRRPSAIEVRVVERDMSAALARLGRQINQMETQLEIAIKGRPCATIEWTEIVQDELI